MASFLSLIIIPISYYFISFRLQIYDFLSKTPSDFLNIFLKGSHGSHGFAQISSLQATVVTMPHSNRYFSARELRIFFRNTNCTNYTNKLLSLERFGRFGRFVFKNQYSTLFFKSHTDHTDLTDFFRCKQRFVYHQDCVSTILLHMVHNY